MNSGAFFSAIALTALGVLWMEAWAGYFTDRLRARASELRDRLLDLVAEGRADAGGPQYQRLRSQLAALAAGPRWLLTPARLRLCAWRAGQAAPAPRPAGDPLSAIEQEMHAALAAHLLRGSLLLWPLAILSRPRLSPAAVSLALRDRRRPE